MWSSLSAGIFTHRTILLALPFKIWVLGILLRSLCLQGKYSIDWAISSSTRKLAHAWESCAFPVSASIILPSWYLLLCVKCPLSILTHLVFTTTAYHFRGSRNYCGWILFYNSASCWIWELGQAIYPRVSVSSFLSLRTFKNTEGD